jgi:hypothetical protein
VDDIELVDPNDCCVCGAAHDGELHDVVLGLRAWLKDDLARRLERPMLPKPFKRRANQKVFAL